MDSSVQILWKLVNISGHRVPPIGHPKCGFNQQYCKLSSDIFGSTEFILGVVFIIIVIFILSWFAFRYIPTYLVAVGEVKKQNHRVLFWQVVSDV